MKTQIEVIIRELKNQEGGNKYIAIFPYEQGDYNFGSVTYYVEIGEHSQAMYRDLILQSKVIKNTDKELCEFISLLASIYKDYHLKFVSRFNYKKYTKMYETLFRG